MGGTAAGGVIKKFSLTPYDNAAQQQFKNNSIMTSITSSRVCICLFIVFINNLGYAESQCQGGYSPVTGDVDSVILVDTDNSCVRVMTFSGDHTILAGTSGSTGYRDGKGNSALFKSPTGVVISPDSVDAMVLDYGNNLIRRINIASWPVAVCVQVSSYLERALG